MGLQCLVSFVVVVFYQYFIVINTNINISSNTGVSVFSVGTGVSVVWGGVVVCCGNGSVGGVVLTCICSVTNVTVGFVLSINIINININVGNLTGIYDFRLAGFHTVTNIV